MKKFILNLIPFSLRSALKAAAFKPDTFMGKQKDLVRGRRQAGIKGGGTKMAQAFAKRLEAR